MWVTICDYSTWSILDRNVHTRNIFILNEQLYRVYYYVSIGGSYVTLLFMFSVLGALIYIACLPFQLSHILPIVIPVLLFLQEWLYSHLGLHSISVGAVKPGN